MKRNKANQIHESCIAIQSSISALQEKLIHLSSRPRPLFFSGLDEKGNPKLERIFSTCRHIQETISRIKSSLSPFSSKQQTTASVSNSLSNIPSKQGQRQTNAKLQRVTELPPLPLGINHNKTYVHDPTPSRIPFPAQLPSTPISTLPQFPASSLLPESTFLSSHPSPSSTLPPLPSSSTLATRPPSSSSSSSSSTLPTRPPSSSSSSSSSTLPTRPPSSSSSSSSSTLATRPPPSSSSSSSSTLATRPPPSSSSSSSSTLATRPPPSSSSSSSSTLATRPPSSSSSSSSSTLATRPPSSSLSPSSSQQQDFQVPDLCGSMVTLRFGVGQNIVFKCVPRENLLSCVYCMENFEIADGEENGNDRPGLILIPRSLDPRSIDILIDFLKSGTIQLDWELNPKIVHGLVDAAEFLYIQQLIAYLAEYIAKRWKMKNPATIRYEWGFQDDLDATTKLYIQQENKCLFWDSLAIDPSPKINPDEWAWPPTALYEIFSMMDVKQLARMRLISNETYRMINSLPNSQHELRPLVTPSPELIQATLGFGERHCLFHISTNKQANLVEELNDINPVVAIFWDEYLSDLTLNLNKLTNVEHVAIRTSSRRNIDQVIVQLAKLPNLQHLSVDRHSDITRDGLSALSLLPNLQTLVFKGLNGITEDTIQELGKLVHLQRFSIFENTVVQLLNRRVQRNGLLVVENMQQLKTLEIGPSMLLGADGAAALVALPKLEHLTIGDKNLLNQQGAQILATLPRLRYLAIGRNNEIENAGLDSLLAHKHLQILIVKKGNKIQKGKIEDFPTLFYPSNLQYLNLSIENLPKQLEIDMQTRFPSIKIILCDDDTNNQEE